MTAKAFDTIAEYLYCGKGYFERGRYNEALETLIAARTVMNAIIRDCEDSKESRHRQG
jgi:hypothetical protein